VSNNAIPVNEAARDFLPVLERVERDREPTVLVRDGKAVAILIPVLPVSLTCAELAERWPKLEKLPVDDANAFADDLESSRAKVPSLSSAWD
jgi:antitoxin (DNA-binding transcriptional repressor) of toxin-antitoxin stability system